ncbi:MAG: hypothetical protein WCX73_05250 [Candidatus Pacearchaeota archaeon]|jgi:hypothetical protein
MSRPEHLGIVETPEIIRSINARQEEYDRDPEAYERRERLRKEVEAEERQRESYEEEMQRQNYEEQN